MWKHLLAVVLSVVVVPPGVDQASARPRLPPTAHPETPSSAQPDAAVAAVAYVGMPADLVRMADWAVDLFDQAGLELPPLRFVHHGGNTAPCQGRAGLHHRAGGANVVEVCATEPTFATQVTILHETAHAWADRSLTPHRKDAFRELRGWDHWRDYEAAAWHENGTEQAAEILVWGLIDRPIRIVRINQASCDDLEAGYETLTGQTPLHGFRDLC